MTTRTENSGAYDLSYDAKNRLTSVSGAASATFVYDGDGNRVKATLGGVTTYYVGNYYEKQGSTVTKYYYAGGARVAMRQSGTLYYIVTDHLGSTAITTNRYGSEVGELRYYAYGPGAP
jgi:YD repeat-containing protein